jgi:hypothetical protein
MRLNPAHELRREVVHNLASNDEQRRQDFVKG